MNDVPHVHKWRSAAPMFGIAQQECECGNRRPVCPVCHGTGILPGESPPHRHDCGNCKGEGYKELPTTQSTSFYHMR
jgi:DnaJ-class molecular chaperone